jgi:hypothetical protein
MGEHSGNIQGTFREHSGNIQGTFMFLVKSVGIRDFFGSRVLRV